MPWTLTLPCPQGFKQLTSLIFRFAKIYYQKRFNDRSKGFPFGQQPVNALVTVMSPNDFDKSSTFKKR
jgi:hypothetical protein